MNFLSIHLGHNATVALSMNGRIVCAISEERLKRIKNFTGFPVESIKIIMTKYLNGTLANIDKFVFIDETGLALNYIKRHNYKNHEFGVFGRETKNNFLSRSTIYHLISGKVVNPIAKIKRFFNKTFNKSIDKNNILKKIFEINPEIKFDLKKAVFFNHHEMHALSHRYFVDTDKSKYLIFTLDGEGDYLSSTVSIFDHGKLIKISKNSNDSSLGYFYAEVTKFLGLKAYQHEFKVMGMSPYSSNRDVERILENLKDLIEVNDEGKYNSKVVSSLFKYEIEKIFKFEKFENICGAAQLFTERLILKWVKYWVDKTSVEKVILSGGVFMNIKACKEVSLIKEINEIVIVPSASDESLPFGALFKINKLYKQKIHIIKNLYLGNSGQNNIKKFIEKIDKNKFNVKEFINFSNLNDEVAKLLSKNNIIARCVDKEEFGARALGNRSILCNPSKLENIKIINNAIKKRDYWMPFSPSIIKDDATRYFINLKEIDAKFMTCLFDSTELAKEHLVAAIHPIDHTMRPQIVDKENNEQYYDLISKFKQITDIGGLLNTSFNLHGEPNVSSYKDAMHTVENSKLKYLILENYLIEKKD